MTRKTKKHLWFFSFFLGFVFLLVRGEAVGDERLKGLLELQSFLSSLTTLRGEFVQVSPKGHTSRGFFFLSKPGKMRFEYAPPVSLVLISDGVWVSLENKDQEQTDQYPLSVTPLKFLLKEKINFSEDAKVLKIEEREGLLWVTLEAKERLVPGRLTLGYDRGQKQLKAWKVIDARNRETTVLLDHLERGVPLANALFQVRSRPQRSARDR